MQLLTTKHIETDCHCPKKKILSREIAIKFVRSNDQLIDIFTKFPTGYMYSKLVYAPTRGEN